jgi:protein-tyrosine phosphatase
MIKVLFVCMGNICRSPTAQGVFARQIEEAGLAHLIHIDSAGTHAYHIGEPPDSRSQQAALRRGIDLSDQRARQVSAADFEEFDYVLAMDESNYIDLQGRCPTEHKHKIRLFLDFAGDNQVREVPDPYFGGARGFDYVLDLAEQAARGLLTEIRRHIA